MSALDALAWPDDRVAEAVVALGRASGLPLDDAPRAGDPSGGGRVTPDTVTTRKALLSWVAFSAEQVGLEAEQVGCSYRELDKLLLALGPALLPLAREGQDTLRFLALLPGGRGRLRLLAPDGKIHRRTLDDVKNAVSETLHERLRARGLPELIASAGVAPRRQERVLRAIAAERYAAAPMGPFVMLRPHPGASLRAQARHAQVGRAAALFVAAHVAKTALLLASWYLVGRGALSGRFELGWLIAWALALLTTVPLSAVASFAQGRFAITAGRLMKQRLLFGTLRLPPDAVRHEGAGHLLGRVLESTAVEAMFLGGSLAALLAVVELAFAGWILVEGAGGALAASLLFLYALVTAAVVHRVYVRSRRWTDQRLAMTHELVERMVGHRTRLAQEPPEQWHVSEDRVLESYLGRSRELDEGGSLWASLLPRGWVIVGALGLAPAFLSGASGASIAIGVGGVLYGLSALTVLSGGLAQLASAAIAWRRVGPLFSAASRLPPPGDVETLLAQPDDDHERPVLDARDVAFRYASRERTVLRDCSFSIRPGERVLLEGPSGGGKSTMAAVLGGLREPSGGLLLLDGLDLGSLGPAAWRERVATVPQFHENHVLSNSFAFNALMGAEWPPTRSGLEELGEVCKELGLGPLLERMPAGFEQAVGDHGWQLSHGEQSRLYLIRALMQKDARLWILDESFAALDPLTLERCVRVVLRRARTVLVIAHP